MSVVVIETQEAFDSFKSEAGSKLMVVDFFATWCGPCKMISPKVEGFASKYADDVSFYKIDIDDFVEVAEDEGVTAMPTFIFYKNGKKVATMVGADAGKLEAAIKEHK